MFLKSIELSNFLSFGERSLPVQLGALNVLIGPNGSGKSNFIEAIDLIRAAPEQLLAPIRAGGGVRDWLWKGGATAPVARLDVVATHPQQPAGLRYVLAFTETAQRFEIVDERIEFDRPGEGHKRPYFFYRYENGRGVLNVKGVERRLQREDIDPTASILAQRRDPDQYPELTYLGTMFSRIRVYREWNFGRDTAPRRPQKTDLPNDLLASDCSNLGLVLNRLRREPLIKRRLIEALRALYDGIEDFDTIIEGGTAQVFLQEGSSTIPATRLSDGTLRYLCLLAILLHPAPPPLVCIEEPELGLHPDVLPKLADLLKDASRRTQLVVTTHSDELVDALSDMPEAVVVAERGGDGTTLNRIDPDQIKPWLQSYRLGQLWTRGDLGGTRW
jgi:predicted ATPase